MDKKEKSLVRGGAATTATGTAVALGGKSALWAIFSAGPGATLTGAAETSAFLAWCGGGSLAAGGGGTAAGSALLATLSPLGLGIAVAGVGLAGYGLWKSRKNNRNQNPSKTC